MKIKAKQFKIIEIKKKITEINNDNAINKWKYKYKYYASIEEIHTKQKYMTIIYTNITLVENCEYLSKDYTFNKDNYKEVMKLTTAIEVHGTKIV